MTKNCLFHQGEIEMQQMAGEQHNAAKVGQVIQHVIPKAAWQFLQQQSFLWLGIEDDNNQVWTFALTGPPGFINPRNGKLLEITLDEKTFVPEQWLVLLQTGKFVGCLALEFSSRRRIRINGIIKDVSQQQLLIEVQQAYPNCPKYIRKREMPGKIDNNKFELLSSGTELVEDVKNIIEQSDTAFVASTGPNGTDVSHRGGPHGFIRCDATNIITVPDYKGNGLFNTLGNFKVNPSGGMLVVDFDHGYFLQLTGKVNIIFDERYPNIATGGTNRYWQLQNHRWYLFKMQPNIIWENLDYSPHNPE